MLQLHLKNTLIPLSSMFVIHLVFRYQVKVFFLHFFDGVPVFAIFDQDFNKIIKKNRICYAIDVNTIWNKICLGIEPSVQEF